VLEIAMIEMIATFMGVVTIVPRLRPFAERIGLVDRPDIRRHHETATPAIGGLAIFAVGVVPGIFLLHLSREVEGLGLAALVLVAAGVLDDLHRLRWFWRLGAQITAALLLAQVGGIEVDHIGGVLGFPLPSLGGWSLALTVIACVGIINAVNMLDGVDGLAGTVALAVCVMQAIAALYAGNLFLAKDLGIVIAALSGFLVFNLRTPWNRRASIFLGNAGSELLGLIIACASFRLTQNGHHPVGPQIAPFLVAPAVIDCLTLMIRRVRTGASPFLGDRNHFHHLLLDAGFTPTMVVAIITGLTVLIGVAALTAVRLHTTAFAFTGAFLTLGAAYFLATRRRGESVRWLARFAPGLGLIRSRPVPAE
jgi:UDP-GlcNAc:undecaprenyl-phosphate GlcNAc-1-phosphate transferase